MSRRANAEKKRKAENMFLNTDLSQKEIAEMVQVTPKTMSDWVNANDGAWKVSKAARSITKEKVIAAWYQQLDKLNEMIALRPEGERYPTSSETDQMVKIAAAIDKLERSFNFAMYHQALNEFTDYLVRVDQQAAAQVSKYGVEFLKQKTRSINA